jgi:hypothetical protein
MIYDRAATAHMHFSILEASFLENLDFRCCLGVVCAAASGTFIFSFFFSFWRCASVGWM